MTRRSLIKRALLVLGINPAWLTGCVSGRGAEGVSTPAEPTVGPTSTRGTLSTSEIEDLVAFSEVLVQGTMLEPTARRDLIEYLQDRTTRSPEYLSIYRTTVRTLERLAGRAFARLTISERLELIARHRLAATPVRPGEDLGEFPAEMRILRARAGPDLIGGYYRSSAGWATVGYETFPGRCGDLTRYTRAES